MDSNKIEVSIICNTYNHSLWIKDALDGFLNQETSFAFEILIHDDASTDGTQDIIREYEKKFPDVIKPIYQTENQYSKDIDIIKNFQFPRVKGKYIAICEGDDYWIDSHKLQKQYDAMEKHPEVDMCAHAAKGMKAMQGVVTEIIGPEKDVCVIPVEEVILGGGGFVATASLFWRRSMLNHVMECYNMFALDYFLQIWGSVRGGMLYIPDVMSVYRMGVPGSWSARMANAAAHISHEKKVLSTLEVLNHETEGRYKEQIEYVEKEIWFEIKFYYEKKYRELYQKDLRIIYEKQPLQRKIAIRVGSVCPFIVDVYHHLINMYRKKQRGE